MCVNISAFNQAEATASHLTTRSRAGSILGLFKGGSVPLFFLFVVNMYCGGVFLSVRIV